MQKNLKRRRWFSYLLYLTLACMLVLSMTYAKYRTTVTGTGTASVAKVALGGTIDLTKLTSVAPNETCKIEFQVTNQAENGTTISEVSQEYSITVKTTGNLPLKYTLIPKENTADKGDFVTVTTGTPQTVSDSASIVYQWTGGKFPHTDACTHEYELKISWPSDNGGGNAAYADEIDRITLTVDANQAIVQPTTR